MAAFKQAVKFNPNDALSLSSLGVLYKEQGKDNTMVLSLFKRSVELAPSNSIYIVKDWEDSFTIWDSFKTQNIT
jgi:hypothetical protein